MSDSKLMLAKELIKQKHYEEARTLLKTINHLTAEKWLAKLDEVHPPEPADDEIIQPSSPARQQLRRSWMGLIGTIMVIILAIMVGFQQIRLNTLLEDMGALEQDVSELTEVVNSHASDLNILVSDLSAVALTAENADRYAHSHGYSDVGLKTDITR